MSWIHFGGASVPGRSIGFNDPFDAGKTRTLSGHGYGAGLGCFDDISLVRTHGSVTCCFPGDNSSCGPLRAADGARWLQLLLHDGRASCLAVTDSASNLAARPKLLCHCGNVKVSVAVASKMQCGVRVASPGV